MPDRLIERTLRAFSDELSADTPVPGGGSAAAYAGAMGAALAAMVARIAAKKESSEPMRAFAEEMDGLRADFLRFVDEDSAAYGRVATAMKLPRKTDACERAVEGASPMTASDVSVGALMAEAALRGAALNVMINLASVKDPAQVKALSEDLDRVLEGAEEQRHRITDFVESRIAR